jgi:hypothetical protein
MSITTITAKLLDLKEKRAALSAEDRELAKQEEALKSELVDLMAQLGVSEMTIHDKKFRTKTEHLPVAEDWEALYKYIEDNQAFHLLHRRLSARVLADMHENGIEVPGIAWNDRYTVAY